MTLRRAIFRAVMFTAGSAWLFQAADRPAVALPAGVSKVVDSIVQAANDRRPKDAERYAAPGSKNVFPWMEQSSLLGAMMKPEPWNGAVLEPPFTNGARPLAVFTTWHSPESDGDHIHPMLRTTAGWRLMAEIPETETQGYRVTHHALSIRLSPDRGHASLKDTFTVVRSGRALPVAFFRISNDFQVTGLRHEGIPVPFRQAGGIVAVRMPQGSRVDLTMTYGGEVDHPAFSGIRPDLALMNAYYWPHLGRLPATADTSVVVPRQWTAITQGNLVSREDRPAESVFRYRNTLPVNYQSLAAGPYVQRARRIGNVWVYSYLLKDNPTLSDRLMDAVDLALPYFEKRFSPYPYSRYSIVDGGPIMGFAALEGYSFATYGSATLSPSVVSHELSHTWWGGIIPNTYLKSWWNEAFASWSDDRFSRLRNNVSTLHPSDRAWWPPSVGVWEAPLATARHNVEVDTIAYRKGWVVLTLLEEQLGVATFDRCLKAFIRDFQGTLDPGWPQFRTSVEKVTGQDWGWFFAQWVNQPGWPRLRLVNAEVREDGSSGYSVTAQIVQSGYPYRLRVPVRVDGGDQSEARVIFIKDGGQEFEVSVPFRPERIVLDPEFTVPRDLGAEGSTMREIRLEAATIRAHKPSRQVWTAR